MSGNINESYLVRFIKWLENDLIDIIKPIEGLLLFGVGAFLNPSIQSLTKILTDDSIQLSLVLHNKSFYFLLVVFLIYIPYIFSSRKKRKVELDNQKNIISENHSKESQLQEEKRKLSEAQNILNEAQEAISNLKSSHLEDSRYITSRFLALFFNTLKLTANDRISLYMLVRVTNNEYEEEHEYLHIFGRYSVHSDFKKINRLRFPKDQGVIGKSFTNENINSEAIFLSENDKEYLEQTKELGINKETTRNFNMQSRSFYPYVITKGFDERVGVLLCESTTVEKDFNIESINEILNPYNDMIVTFLDYNYKILESMVRENKI